MGFTLRSGNNTTFKEMGSSTPFLKDGVGISLDNIKKPELNLNLKDKVNVGDKLKNIKKPEISLKGKGDGAKNLLQAKGDGVGIKKTEFKIKPKTDAKPKVDIKPKADAKPKVDTKPKIDTKPKVESKKETKLPPTVAAPEQTAQSTTTPATGPVSKEDTFAQDTEGMTPEQQVEAYTSMIEGKADALPEQKSFFDQHKDTAQKYLDTASMVPGPVGKVAGLGSAAIDYRDAYKAWRSGDTDLMKSELASGTQSAVFSGLGPTKQLLKGSKYANTLANKSNINVIGDIADTTMNTGIAAIREGQSPGGSTTT